MTKILDYWDQKKQMPRIIQLRDKTVAAYTREGILNHVVKGGKRVAFYDNGQVKAFTYRDGMTEEYDENGRMIRTYDEHPFPELGLAQRYTYEFIYTQKGKLKWAKGIIESVYLDGHKENLGETFVAIKECPSQGKVSVAHLDEVIDFVRNIPQGMKNIIRMRMNYEKNYVSPEQAEKVYRQKIRGLIEHKIPAMIRE